MNSEAKSDRRVILLFGPTAVGKTDLLDSLFSGKGEIISADSMQVYRFMDIGTAKPSKELLLRLPHHLIDILDPKTQFHAGDFLLRSEALVDDIAARGKLPVIAGGTGFYFHNFLFGLPRTPACDRQTREMFKERLETRGLSVLYEELKAADPVSASKISAADSYRILRALEVYHSTGMPLSDFPRPRTVRNDMKILLIGLNRDREELYRRIDSRVDQMFSRGLFEEFRSLRTGGYGPEDPGMKSIGYGEFFDLRREGCLTLAGVKDRIKRNSRRYAKRQLTFFRPFPGVCWFHPRRDFDGIRETLRRFLET